MNAILIFFLRSLLLLGSCHEISAAIRFIDEQIKTEATKRVLHMSDAALNDAKQALVDLEAKHSQLGLNRAGVESKVS